MRRRDKVVTPHSLLERATDGARTRDLRLGKPPLYQLSYYRNDKITTKMDFYCLCLLFFETFLMTK
jgi:hypothetical protein